MMRSATLLAAAVGIAAVSAPAAATSELGRVAYQAHCAQCHGISGRGDGVVAPFLTAEMPDLTRIQARNGGIFPFRRVWQIMVDGGDIGAHGTRDMPAWGTRLAEDARLLYGVEVHPADRLAYTQAHLLALADYIASMQEMD